MALKALDIFKLLPKTNCKKCGCPTCLAFAMKLAQKQASLDQCPDVSSEAKATLEGSAAPPVRLVTIGAGPRKVEIGNETVMFRHDETFYHPPAIGSIVPDNLDAAALAERVAAVGKLQFVRVGTAVGVNVVAVENVSRDAGTFKQAVAAVAALNLPLVLMTADAAHAEAALAACKDARPLLYGANAGNLDAFAAVAKAHHCALALTAPDLDALAALTARAKAAGVEDLVLDLTGDGPAATLQSLTAARRLAIRKSLRALGYPALAISRRDDAMENVAESSSYVAKYAGVVLTTLCRPEEILPILTVSQNLYTDPRKPIQVEAKLYEIGAVTADSPLLITTNFSLTYYTVEGEVEASRVPAYIGVIDTEGTSVLTAFASDKMTADNVAAFLNSAAVAAKVKHRKVIIPGYVAVMSGGLKEASGWDVMVGPREASGISKYLKTVWKA